MNIEIDIDFLLKNSLNIEQYLLLDLIASRKVGYLRKYISSFPSAKENIDLLAKMNYIRNLNEGNEIDVSNLMIRVEFKELVKQTDYFEEFYDIYPVKIIRPDGITDYLRQNTKECRDLYAEVTENKKHKHDRIIELLKYEIKHKEMFNKMSYMKRMTNWLRSETWKETEERIQHEPYINNNNTLAYGQELI